MSKRVYFDILKSNATRMKNTMEIENRDTGLEEITRKKKKTKKVNHKATRRIETDFFFFFQYRLKYLLSNFCFFSP